MAAAGFAAQSSLPQGRLRDVRRGLGNGFLMMQQHCVRVVAVGGLFHREIAELVRCAVGDAALRARRPVELVAPHHDHFVEEGAGLEGDDRVRRGVGGAGIAPVVERAEETLSGALARFGVARGGARGARYGADFASIS
jgi:hypothetical protein